MSERSCLKKGDTILLVGKSNGKEFERTFTVNSKIKEGSSVVCYDARYDGGTGTLKEFYPDVARGGLGLKRKRDKQLVCLKDFGHEFDMFVSEKERYKTSHEKLIGIRIEEKSGGALKTFIPPFEIYESKVSGDETGTIYIWSSAPKLKTFAEICEDIHRNPSKKPEYNLFRIMSTVRYLTQGVLELHKRGLVHRDIKPSNIGFVERNGETLTQTLSLFDIDTVCSVYDTGCRQGTPGFMDDETETDNKTDIYSIGATLFNAIVTPDKKKEIDNVYQKKYFDDIPNLVRESAIIRASEVNSYPRLAAMITVILKKCLCGRKERYESCEELLEDLEKALQYFPPVGNGNMCVKNWKLVENEFDKNANKNSSLLMLYHLYEHPLYEFDNDDGTDLNILMIGFGNYGQKFLDACLQVGQMRGKTPNVTVVSDDPTDKEIYLSARPEIDRFFNINGASEGTSDVYGNIDFITRKFDFKSGNKKRVIEDIICSSSGREPCYVFIALGADSLNKNAANFCKDALNCLGIKCSVNYVCETYGNGRVSNKINPVYVNENVKDRYPEIYRDIERMAFNVHLIWQKDPNADYAKVKKEFQIKYNHDSCVAKVISMKYKLHGMGLELDGNYGDVADDYYSKYNRTDKEFKNEMNRIEHKRWVTEKICLGWKHRDIDDCLTGKTKDDKKKEHICILKSRAEDPFFDKEWEDGNKWDNATKYDLEKLDDLDKMTVMLYRKLKEKANVINESKLNEIKNQIKQIVENNRRTFVAFLEWDSCIKDVLGNDKKRAAMYGGLRDSFIAAADDLSDIDREAVSFRVHEFDEMIYPKIACLKRHVWKKDDEDLVKNIPFILTYSSDIYLAIPYCAGITADELFRNVAAPTAAKPSGIIYLYRVKDKRDVLNLDDSFVFIKSYLTKKKLRAKVEFAILCEDEKLAGKIASGGIGGAKATCFSSGRDIVSWLKKRSKKHDLLAYEFNGSNFIHSGVDALPSYEFDSKKAAFCELSSCDALKHIGSKPKPYITVSDMFSLSSSSSTSTNNPLFFEDYRKLWSIYTGFNKSKFQYSLAWKKLCKLLGDYFRKKDQLVELEFNKKADVVKTTNYTIDISCMKSVEKLIGKLKDKCVLNEESGVFCQNDNRCKVFISDPYDNIEKYNDLFNNKMSFLKCADDVDAVISFEDGKKKCVIVNETLEVKGINLNELSDKNNAKFTNTNISTARNILENLNKPENGFIRNLSEKPTDIKSGGTQSAPERSNVFGFTISTKEIKDILTVEGRMLEVYVYHKLKESGAFDDVVSSYEVNLEEKEVKNEFDCIATKGFRSLIIECKARKQIEAEFLYKINALALHFGVNAKTVLIAETNEWTDKNDNTANDMQRIRADIMNIEVICNNNDIENIGDSLSRIIRQ